eukprot:TRINITY_DN65265_c0_g1_i1.p1 TRINITY_DN65265_c0_g1~~TRINITY_DN65265_c0_g1_i1.p1  ORF type:complete len:312 (+),score=41.36 TRINITY_DN65265_c0_g1_i1:102-1037(+)
MPGADRAVLKVYNPAGILESALTSHISVLKAKRAAAQKFHQPPQLQRWLRNGEPLEDEDVLIATEDSPELEVQCVFLPTDFPVVVKVIRYAPTVESELASTVTVSTTPTMTISALKFKISNSCGLSARGAKIYLDGTHMEDARTMESYRVDAGDTIHFVVPGRVVDASRGYSQNANQQPKSIADLCHELGFGLDAPEGPWKHQARVVGYSKAMAAIPAEIPTTGLTLLRSLSATNDEQNRSGNAGSSQHLKRTATEGDVTKASDAGKVLLSAALSEDLPDARQETRGIRLLRQLSDQHQAGHLLLREALGA